MEKVFRNGKVSQVNKEKKKTRRAFSARGKSHTLTKRKKRWKEFSGWGKSYRSTKL